jgi:hypothetical protein
MGQSIAPGTFRYLDFVAPGELRPLSLVTNLASGSTPVNWATWNAAVVSMQPMLEELRLSLRSPAPRSDVDYRSLGSIPNYVARRNAAQWLAGEAWLALHATNREASTACLESLLALADLHRDDPTVVNQMIRVAIGELAFEVTAAGLPVDGWSERQLARLQAAWERPRFYERLVTAFECERSVTLSWLESVRTNGSVGSRTLSLVRGSRSFADSLLDDYVLDPMYRKAWAVQDQLFFLERFQEMLQAMRAANQHRNWIVLGPELTRICKVFEDQRGMDRLRHRMSLMSLPNFNRAIQLQFGAETQRSMCLAALAIRRYELRHGRPPATLEDLIPGLLDARPVDWMDGGSLGYRLLPDGSWRLYSTGHDGRDDGGDAGPPIPWAGYDSIWDGRDAVWPRVASATSLEPVIPPGEPMPLIQFTNAPMRDVILALARQLNLNLLVDPEAEPILAWEVTSRWENRGCGEVLQAVLDSRGLHAVRAHEGKIVCITRR